MTRLIDAESLWKAISNVGFPALNRNGYIDRQCVYELIKKAPTVPLPDFKEGYKQAIIDGKTNFSRPKGKWIKTNDYVTCAYGCIDYVKCSCCKNDSLEEGDYCPNCGADMREADDGSTR